MARPTPLSGFPEWLPEGRLVEQHVLDVLRRTFELHGFAGIETRAVEPLDQLLRKGETSKEVYVLRRLQEDPDEAATRGHRETERGLGLHFDLTVPFARYVLENAGHLAFPFRRYQIQKVWRGERPQDGRFREFVQADIDVVGAGTLPYHYEVELPLVMAEALGALREIGVPPVRILVNNRKVAEGFYRGLGLTDVEAVLRNIDKLDKIGADAVAALLVAEAGATEEQARACLALAAISGSDESVVERVRELAGESNDLLDEGLAELGALIRAASVRAPGVVVADLKIARGLDYYTGSVYETVLVGHEQLGSICSGGRYDTLASDGANTYPGVGLSIGVSRLVSRLLSKGLVTTTRSVPSAVLVAVSNEDDRGRSDAVAAALRARGIPVEVAPSAAKFGKQIRHADRRGIPFVWFVGDDESGADQVKDIRSGEQVDAEASTWTPVEADLWPRVVPA
ncbi:histidine--tRNA ligase [Cellulomonas terrae]|uniref:Histidine--tRNA ligase n=1 Tax=Cellulomonas terrae TaxID=311234 RepID=A0A511JHH8_9CELL|nr:histidine--tRNA ligase [Cellulomonas terrae]GEL97133.1 histidine--tRNA ligase [Cellulomonas terrae]